MKILILGDSHCAYTHRGSWMASLGKLTGAKIHCYGESGCSNWVIYKNFLKYYNPSYDYIFVMLTAEHRTPYVEGDSSLCALQPGAHPLWDKFSQVNTDYATAAKLYMQYFYNKEFLDWTSYNIIKSIENYPLGSNQKIVWVNCLLSPNMYSNISKGILIKNRLLYFSQREMLDMKNIPDYVKLLEFIDDRANHFTFDNQYNLAKFYANILNKDKDNLLTYADLDLANVEWERDPTKLNLSLSLKK